MQTSRSPIPGDSDCLSPLFEMTLEEELEEVEFELWEE